MRTRWYVTTRAVSLVMPWKLGERPAGLAGPPASCSSPLSAALLSALLLSWTYLAGKAVVQGFD